MDNQSNGVAKSLMSAVSTLIALQITTLLVAVGGGAYFLRALKQDIALLASNAGRPDVPENVQDWRALIREHNAVQGPEDAKVILIEFSDFQCPFCKQYSDGTRNELVTRYGDDVRMVFKHLPLQQIHPQAMTAAIAAQCARREGKFWDAHERFFAQPEALSVESLISVGKSLGLSSSYDDCVVHQETRGEVERDLEDALEAGIQGTPTFVVNGKVLVGAQSPNAFRAAFEQAGLHTN